MKKNNIFKEGDLVRVIDIEGLLNSLIINRIYIVYSYDNYRSPEVYLDEKFNHPDVSGGFFSYRFKKIKAGDLTSEELISYMKYKFKIGQVI